MTEKNRIAGIDAIARQAEEWLAAALGLAPGDRPFPWQCELLRRLLAEETVEALDIPTGLGKTAVMAIWLVALASGARVARRLVYVVDRRAVVDQATDVAERLRSWVAATPAVAEALGVGGRGLAISTLRGQHVDNRAWLEDPAAPAIVVGTVDMVGSRLLFAGYGVSAKMRPYHAGLLGVDTLLVLDEAHLSQPFERLIEQIARGVDANGRSLRPDGEVDSVVPRFRSLSLSATGRARSPERVLRLSAADRKPGGTVAKRLAGRKQLRLLADASEKELPDILAREAWALAEQGASRARVLVFCTSRDHAQKVQDALAKLAKGSPPPVLLVGERRVHERELAAQQLRELGFVAGSASRPDAATFVIATAAGEVGVDLDADHCACDLVAWERMVQRLGRVNRRGDGDARVVVVPAPSTDEAEQARRDATRELLGRLPADGAIDVSLAALTGLKEAAQRDGALRDLVDRATTPAPLHPPLTRALVEAWSMTSLAEHTGRPEVAPWIRGWPDEEERPQTTLVWRTHLPVDDSGAPLPAGDLELFADGASPHLAERLEVETHRVLAWLDKRLKALGRGARGEETPWTVGPDTVLGMILDGREAAAAFVRGSDVASTEKRKRLDRPLAGATLVLDARLGGLRDGLLFEDANEPAIDVSDVGADPKDRVVPFRVRRIDDDETNPPGWRTESRIPIARNEDGATSWLAIESVVDDAAESEEGRSTARRAQLLAEHEEWTEAEARRIGRRIGLAAGDLELLMTAARLHDEGKKAERWQRAFHVPNDGVPPFAKSTTKRPNLALLAGYRHELGSLPYAEAHPRVIALEPAARELCLHVIAAHHGGARPVLRTDGASEPPSRLEERAGEIALRFAALEKRWGPWGLAWWEALLRAADQTASRKNDEQGGRHG